MRIRLSTDLSTASASSWHTVQFRRMLMREEQTERTNKRRAEPHRPRERHHSQLGIRDSFHTRNGKEKTGREGDRETRTGFGRDARFFLGNYGNGTEVCFEGTVTTYTFAWNKRGKKMENGERWRSAKCRVLVGLIGERSTMALGWQTPTIVEREYQSCSLEILFLQGKPIM